MIIRVSLIVFVTLVVAQIGQAQTWPLQPYHWGSSQGLTSPQFLYVPKMEIFTHVVLTGILQTGGDRQILSVYVDGNLAGTVQPSKSGSITIPLPSLSAGYHRVRVTGHSLMLNLETPSIPQVACVYEHPLPMNFYHIAISYRRVLVSSAKLAGLPDGLFNPAYPGTHALIAQLSLEPASPEAKAAALQLAGWFRAARTIHWETTGAVVPNFMVILRKNPELSEPAQLTLARDWLNVAPELLIEYRSTNGLNAAIHAILNPIYRNQLTSTHALIPEGVTAPDWGILADPHTLAQLGLTDTLLEGNQRHSFTLDYPVYWQPSDVLQGNLRLQVQAGLIQGSHLNVWSNTDLLGSQNLQSTPGSSTAEIQQNLPLKSAAIPKTPDLPVILHSVLLASPLCGVSIPGSLVINAQKSKIRLPHRDKTGVLQYMPSLVVRPVFHLSGSGTMEAALAIVEEEQSVLTSDASLPYRVVSGAKKGYLVNLSVDPKKVHQVVRQFSSQINPLTLQSSIILEQTTTGVHWLAESATVFQSLWRRLPDVLRQIPDGAKVVLINVQNGEVLVLDRSPTVILHPTDIVSSSQFRWVVLASIGGFLLVGSLLFYWIRKKKHGT